MNIAKFPGTLGHNRCCQTTYLMNFYKNDVLGLEVFLTNSHRAGGFIVRN